MAVKTDVFDQVMNLSTGKRAELARRLILSLEDYDSGRDLNKLWEAEIEARLSEVDRGAVKLLDWRPSLRRVRQKLRAGKVK